MAASDPSTTEPQSSPPHPPSLSAVLSESLRIIKSHFPQLLFLSSLYLFPKAFASIAHPTRQSLIKAHRPFPPTYQPETLLALVFSVYSSVVSVSGYVFYSLGLWYVTHTVGKPTTCNSVSVSVLPLLASTMGYLHLIDVQGLRRISLLSCSF
ncbi:uncharacterized protein LOC133726261 [Rosa rugosa]|uniref:uncharacterized protein LOC133726261 n=1 Tax=Rosa rugosa TaxID=74645 RepID=UPI002B4172A5|nr:uncharacterized protein LOC133726261 [Rosa rugosa]